MTGRRNSQEAVDAFADVIESLGVVPDIESATAADMGHDLVIITPDGRSIAVQIKSTSLASAQSVPGQLRRWAGHLEEDVVGVVVADRITAEARDDLNRAGWGWLDLRGHVRFTGPGLFVDADVPALARQESGRSGIGGPVGAELAALLLLDPAERLGVREAAMVLSRAPSSVSAAFAALRAAELVSETRHPAVPALFWALSELWEPAGHDIARLPAPGRAGENAVLRLGLDDVESGVGWALTDTVAAGHYGAPIAMRADYPPDFYVPDQPTFRRAEKLLGSATASSSRAGRVHVAPVPLVCARRVDASGWASSEWPLAHPLFVALDLARDPGRGREVLDSWTPEEPWDRVW